jgi:hypothetical protein
MVRTRRNEPKAFLYAFRPAGAGRARDLRREPIEAREATLASILRQRRDGLRLSKRLELTVFQHACADGRAAPAAERRDGQPPIRTQGETVVFENRILNEIEAPVLLYGQ